VVQFDDGIPNGEIGASRKEPSVLEDTELYITMRQWFNADQAHSAEWRTRAKGFYDFVSGRAQWSKAARGRMESEDRVPITINVVAPVLKAVAGIEINTRHETIYLPRGMEEGDIVANEALTDASNWMADGCGAKHQESYAFQDVLKVGMGWVEERLDFELDPDGKYIEERLDPLGMWWDCSARAQNLTDSRRRWRARRMNIVDARAMFPGHLDQDLNCTWTMGVGPGEPNSNDDRRLNGSKSSTNGDVTILQVQWWEREKYHRVANPFTGQVEDHDSKSLKALVKAAKDYAETTGQYIPVESVEQTRRVYKQAFIGGKILKKSDCPRRDGFTLNCITGEPDHNSGSFAGLLDAMEDPQKMLNKWLSQATHIINTTAKGGILAEEDAFTDQRSAESTYARPDSITWVKNGALGKGKIREKPGVGLAGPYIQLFQMAMDMIPRVTGINMELMGLRDAQQPGVLEAQRKQAAMTILATIFDNLQQFRVEVGKTRLSFIQNHLSDGRLIRVLGPEGGYKAVRLMKDKVVGEFDVIVSEAPQSPNNKEQTWAALQVVLPVFRDMMTPQVATLLLDYVPGIPKQLVDGIRGLMQQSMQPNPEAQEVKKLGFEKKAAEIDRDRAAAEKDRAQAQNIIANAMLDGAALEGRRIKNAAEQAKAVGVIAKTVNDIRDTGEEYAIAPVRSPGAALPRLDQVALADDQFNNSNEI